jgi:hypothetical protein
VTPLSGVTRRALGLDRIRGRQLTMTLVSKGKKAVSLSLG